MSVRGHLGQSLASAQERRESEESGRLTMGRKTGRLVMLVSSKPIQSHIRFVEHLATYGILVRPLFEVFRLQRQRAIVLEAQRISSQSISPEQRPWADDTLAEAYQSRF